VCAGSESGSGEHGDVGVAYPVGGDGVDGLLGAAVDGDAEVALVGVLFAVDGDARAGECQRGGRSVGGGEVNVAVEVAEGPP
jgi:hypothetical protein